MSRSSLLALLLFSANTVAAVGLMWLNRPRTVATLSDSQLDPVERRRLQGLLYESGVVPSVVYVCTVAPCTSGPAIFLEDGSVVRVVLPQAEGPVPVVEMWP